MLVLSQSEIEKVIDLSQFAGRFNNADDEREFFGTTGDQHYRLLAYLSTQFYGRDILDIGTHRGSSALALSYNVGNTVHTFDIDDRMANELRMTKWAGRDIQFHKENLWDPAVRLQWRERILAAPIIFMDIDPHDGPMELEMFRWLKAEGYSGLLVCDDIWYFKGMRDAFWFHIPAEDKVDATLIGHWSGTGIVHFGAQSIEVRETAPSRADPTADTEGKNWTVVTAYFNLTKRPDASAEIKARPQSYYMQHANMTMATNENLVVFCDADSREALEAMRPAHLKARTKWIIREFDEFELIQTNYEFIKATREAKGYAADPRNTTSYYLFCMLRYAMLQETMATNPFNSTHFAWCNICIERMSWKSGAIFPHVWSEFRDKFSTCYIDYQPRSLTADLAEYYKWGRCGMCSGFFTGSREYMGAFCEAVLAKFAQMTALGYGHADEQLFTLVFFDRPEIFEFYLGDYTEMITNYGWVRDRADQPPRNVLSNLAKSGENPSLLRILVQRWLDSAGHGCFKAAPQTVESVRGLLATA